MRVKTSVLILISLGLWVYFNSLFNNFIGDDYDQIIRNTAVHHIANIPKFFLGSTYESGGEDRLVGIYYRPIMLTIFSLVYSFFGEQPLYFHLFQVAIHIANAILVYIFLRQFLKNGVAFFASLIFLVHPINNETAVYVANLQDALFFFFGMLALVLTQQKRLSIKKYFLILLFLLLSLFSKESGVLFLIIFLIYILIFNRKFLKPIYLSMPFIVAAYLKKQSLRHFYFFAAGY